MQVNYHIKATLAIFISLITFGSEPESLYQQEPETDFLTMNQDTLARYALGKIKHQRSLNDIYFL